MKRTLVVLALSCGAFARTVVADDAVYAKQLEAKAASVVVLKLVTKVGEYESSQERMGTIVDPVGVVMTTGLGSARGGTKVTIVSARVAFPGEEKEYDAILGAFDTRVGLAFFRIKDLAGRAVTSLNVSDAGEIALGDEVFGVSRLEEGFDYAPFYGTAKIVGQVTKPRAMWMASGGMASAASTPLYTATGKFAGVVISQMGVSDGPRWTKPFLLPASAAQPLIAQAVKASAKALEESKEREKKGEGDAVAVPPEPPAMDEGTPAAMDGAK